MMLGREYGRFCWWLVLRSGSSVKGLGRQVSGWSECSGVYKLIDHRRQESKCGRQCQREECTEPFRSYSLEDSAWLGNPGLPVVTYVNVRKTMASLMVTKWTDVRVWPGAHPSPMDPSEAQLLKSEKLGKWQLMGSLLIPTDNIDINFSPLATSLPVTLSSTPLQAALPMGTSYYHIIITNWNPSADSISRVRAFHHHVLLSPLAPVLQFQQFFNMAKIHLSHQLFTVVYASLPFPFTTC